VNKSDRSREWQRGGWRCGAPMSSHLHKLPQHTRAYGPETAVSGGVTSPDIRGVNQESTRSTRLQSSRCSTRHVGATIEHVTCREPEPHKHHQCRVLWVMRRQRRPGTTEGPPRWRGQGTTHPKQRSDPAIFGAVRFCGVTVLHLVHLNTWLNPIELANAHINIGAR